MCARGNCAGPLLRRGLTMLLPAVRLPPHIKFVRFGQTRRYPVSRNLVVRCRSWIEGRLEPVPTGRGGAVAVLPGPTAHQAQVAAWPGVTASTSPGRLVRRHRGTAAIGPEIRALLGPAHLLRLCPSESVTRIVPIRVCDSDCVHPSQFAKPRQPVGGPGPPGRRGPARVSLPSDSPPGSSSEPLAASC